MKNEIYTKLKKTHEILKFRKEIYTKLRPKELNLK